MVHPSQLVHTYPSCQAARCVYLGLRPSVIGIRLGFIGLRCFKLQHCSLVLCVDSYTSLCPVPTSPVISSPSLSPMQSSGAGLSRLTCLWHDANNSSSILTDNSPPYGGCPGAISRSHFFDSGASSPHIDAPPRPKSAATVPDVDSDSSSQSGDGPLTRKPTITVAHEEAAPSGGQFIKFEVYCECTRNSDGRNLVVCIDGTANQFSFRVRNLNPLYCTFCGSYNNMHSTEHERRRAV